MEPLVQKCIASAKRIRDEWKSVISILNSASSDLKVIKDATQSIDKKTEAAQKTKEPPSEMNAVVSLKTPIETKRDCYDTNQQRRDRWRLGVEIATFIAVFGYGYLTFRMWRETISNRHQIEYANKTTREALVTVQRAFVFLGNNSEAFYQKPGDPWEFRFDWKNSGTTPTKNLVVHISYKQFHGGKMPDTYSFPDLYEKERPHTASATYVGPQGSVQNVVNVPYADIMKFHQHRDTEPIYFYGWAKYHDVFDKTDEHITRFCLQLESIDETKPAPYSMPMSDCPHFNCWDNECKVGQ